MDSSIWLSDQIQAVSIAEDMDSLMDALTNAAKNLGFEFAAFGLRIPFPLSSPRTEIINNYPKDWQNSYAQNEYLSIDPTVQHGLKSTAPLIWSEGLFVGARSFWEEARYFGLNHGWAQACRDAEGNVGMLTLARSDDELAEKELRVFAPYLSWLAQLAHTGVVKLVASSSDNPTLTLREVEVLRWAAEGKTTWEISVILGLSERTVTFHMNNAGTKLGVSNKTAAVVKAAILGMI